MKKNLSRLLSLVLVLVMVLTAMPASAADMIRGDGQGSWWDWWVTPAPIGNITHPEQTFNAELEDGTTVTVVAREGILPAKTRMTAQAITNIDAVQAAVDQTEGVSGTVLTAVDITFMNGNVEVQPNGSVKVMISNDAIAGMDDLSVVHLDVDADELEGDEQAELVENAQTNNEGVVFNARHFSVYAVVDPEVVDDHARLKVSFFGEDTVHPLKTVYIKQTEIDKVDEIIDFDPEVITNSLTLNDRVFCGWIVNKIDYAVSDFTSGDKSINKVRDAVRTRLGVEVAEGDELNVYAMIFYEYCVKYVSQKDENDKNPVIEAVTLYSKTGNPVEYEVDLTYTPTPISTTKFNGWTISGGDQSVKYNYGDTISVQGDITLMPDVSSGHWISFNEKPTDEYKGATYVAPKFFENGQSMNGFTPNESDLAGYDFAGWYRWGKTGQQDNEGNDIYDYLDDDPFVFSGTLSENITLAAKWEMFEEADYTVIVWQQDVNDPKTQNLPVDQKNYNYVFSAEVKNAPTDVAISASTISAYTGYAGNGSVSFEGNTYSFLGFKYFTYTVTNGKDGKINPAGNTIINVYYDRALITLNFLVSDTTQSPVAISGATPSLYWGSPVYFLKSSSGSTYYPIRYYNTSYTYMYEPTTNSYSTTNQQYAVVDGIWYELDYAKASGSSTYYWWYESVEDNTWHVWTGTRYKYSDYFATDNLSQYTIYTYPYEIRDTMTGLFGSTLEKNGYTWPLDKWWYDQSPLNLSSTVSRTRTTFLDAFIPATTATTVNYYGQYMAGTNHAYFYKQNKTGTGYDEEATNTMEVAHGTNGSSFYLSNKYNGFTVAEYSTTSATSGFLSVGEPYTTSNGDIYYYANDGSDKVSYSADLYIHFTRNQYKIEYMWGAFLDGNGVKLNVDKKGEIESVDGIYYEASIDSYKKGGTNYFDPTRTLNDPAYVFEGWYKDPECTVPFDFEDMEMPANNIAVFARFRTIQYRVFLRNCGNDVEFNDENQSQNFRVYYNALISDGQPIDATLDGKVLAGWYLDPDFNEPFDFSTQITNTNTVDYNKEDPENYTDSSNGSQPWTYNSDAQKERTWITQKLDLYAKWVTPLPNVDGINVIYDSNSKEGVTGTRQGNGARYYTDPALYSDGVTAYVRTASTPDSSVYTFDYWELLDNNGEVLRTYKPGEKFVINAATMAWENDPTNGGSKGASGEQLEKNVDAQRSGSNSGATVKAGNGKTYELVTTAPSNWTGNYVITVGTSTNINYVLKAVSPTSNGADVEDEGNRTAYASSGITLSGSTLSGVSDEYVMTIAETGSYYTVKCASNSVYFGMNSSSTLCGYTTYNSSYCRWTPGISNGKVQLKNYANGNYPYFSWSTSYNYFWAGSTNNANVLYLWKEVDSGSGSGEGTQYRLTTSIQSGKTYLIVYGDANTAANSSMYVMSSTAAATSGYLAIGTPTFTDSTHTVIEAVTGGVSAYEWTAGTGSVNGTYTFVNNGKYLVETGDYHYYLYANNTSNNSYRNWNVVKTSYDYFNIHNYYWHDYDGYYYYLYYTTTGFTNYYRSSSYTPGNMTNDGYRMYLYEKLTGTKYTVTASVSGGNGSVDPASAEVYSGGSADFTAYPNDGYRLASATLAPANAGTVAVNGNTITVSGVTAACALTVTFEAIPTYTVTFMNGETTLSTQQVREGAQPAAPADPTPATGKEFAGWRMEGSDTVYTSNALPEITANTVFYAVFTNAPVYGTSFEVAPASEGWTFVDANGDGYNWEWNNLNATQTFNVYEGSGIIYSESYHNTGSNSGVALTPDNWAISPSVNLPTGTASVTLYARGQSATWYAENFAIYVIESANYTPGGTFNASAWTKVGGDFVVNATYQQYEANLSAFIGKSVYIAIRHYNITDQFILNVDMFQVWGEDASSTEPEHPDYCTVTFIYRDANGVQQTTEVPNVPYGGAAQVPGDACTTSYSVVENGETVTYYFLGWSTTFDSVTSDMTVVANYGTNTANVDLNTQVVIMRAHYTEKQYTWITWHANNDTKQYKNSNSVQINENIAIEYPVAVTSGTGSKDGETVSWVNGGDLIWEDHEFLGWARVAVGDETTKVYPKYDPANPAYDTSIDFSEDDLFLKWNADGKYFESLMPENPPEGQTQTWKKVTYVAADELMPYHAMYAVWASVFYVYHSADNTVEKIVTTKGNGNENSAYKDFDITKYVRNPGNNTNGYLYGGYYKDYAGKSTGFDAKDPNLTYTAAKRLEAVAVATDAGATAYNGSNVTWSWDDSYNVDDNAPDGMHMRPEAGATYYLKEVPANKYLQPYLHYGYNIGSGAITSAFLISDIDDRNYQETGFVIETRDDRDPARIARAITFNSANTGVTVKLNSNMLFGASGYLSYLQVIGGKADPILSAGNKVKQYWLTPDGLYVTGTTVRQYTGLGNVNDIGKSYEAYNAYSVSAE